MRGHAGIRAEPDEAFLWVALTALRDTPGAAIGDVTARNNSLSALLEELGVARADRSTSGITVREEFEYTEKRHRRSLGHLARVEVSARVADPEVLGKLITRAAGELDAHIEGPSWQIARDNPVRLEAARQAAADGRRKAEAYADGVGARLGRLLELSESGDGYPLARASRMSAHAMAAGPPDSMDVEPGEHEVTASIQVTFALELDSNE